MSESGLQATIQWNKENAIYTVTAKVDGIELSKDVIATDPSAAVVKYKFWFVGQRIQRARAVRKA